MPGREPTKEKLFAAIKRGDIAEVQHLLLDRGADVNARNQYDRAPLHVACYRGRVDIVQLLLDHGADVEARDEDGNTPLHWACINGHTDTARLLLDRGADVGAHDKKDRIPLHYACIFCGHPDIVRLLLDRGADVNARDKWSWSPLDFVCDLPEDSPDRQPLLEAFQELAPEAWFTKFCESQGKTPGRGM